MAQQSQEKQESERMEKEEQIIKMNISKFKSIAIVYFENKRLEIMQKSGFNF